MNCYWVIVDMVDVDMVEIDEGKVRVERVFLINLILCGDNL